VDSGESIVLTKARGLMMTGLGSDVWQATGGEGRGEPLREGHDELARGLLNAMEFALRWWTSTYTMTHVPCHCQSNLSSSSSLSSWICSPNTQCSQYAVMLNNSAKHVLKELERVTKATKSSKTTAPHEW
jgi:hypothetical protein